VHRSSHRRARRGRRDPGEPGHGRVSTAGDHALRPASRDAQGSLGAARGRRPRLAVTLAVPATAPRYALGRLPSSTAPDDRIAPLWTGGLPRGVDCHLASCRLPPSRSGREKGPALAGQAAAAYFSLAMI
jgi:hypothetical protein